MFLTREKGKSQEDSRQLPSLQGKREAVSRQLGHQLPWTQMTLRDPGPVSASELQPLGSGLGSSQCTPSLPQGLT